MCWRSHASWHLGPRSTTGDRVAAFAAAAFATHVTVDANQAVKLPAAISYEAGATIPVAFLTAYYSLVTQAKLKRGEWVLIHGGAGGVGMAAIQIALARKARVIATAGSRAKRDLLKILGVPYTLDSRSMTFVDDVRDGPEAIAIMVDRGLGVSLLPDWPPPWPEGLKLRKIPLPDRSFRRQIGLLWLRASLRAGLIRAFLQEVLQRPAKSKRASIKSTGARMGAGPRPNKSLALE
jgi:hypothetical protein